ncbi:hypothetical protein IV203_015286 [Nitzschia inconspicua]|uniref:Uncharacterized protein n=1 Tax=Nitzschia inconspicua TaxID=303405 RepID=A0A9K3K5Y4_9STRA|nr:hypothetical protein IV203_020241 [Nitzschia inconspicua]KAG7358697.1 hypothetical protein IV203_015286 [Nitzschia inconspicua]
MDDFLSATTAPSNVATDEYCSIPTNILDDFETVSFQNTKAIRWMHDIPPRYGKPDDVLLLMAGDEEQQKDYMRGLLASSITMFVFFLVWSLLLLIFKCFAPPDSSNVTRWLAGERLRIDEPPSKEHKPFHHSEWQKKYDNTKKQLYCFRGIVLFAGLSIIVSAIVMSVLGTNSLTNTLDSVRLSLGLVHGLASEATGIVDQVIDLNQNVSSKIFTLLEDINGMCPLVRDPLCDDLQDLNSCDLSGFLGDDLSQIFQTVVGHFAAGERSVIYQEIIKARSGLDDVRQMALDVDNAASHFNWVFFLSMAFSLFLALLCLFIISSLLFRMPEMMLCLKSRILLPIFVVLVIFSYIFSLLFVTASMTTADVCIYKDERNNLDVRVLTLLGRFQEALGPIVVEFARFYIRQCPPELLPRELVGQMDYIIAGVPAIREFSSIVEESTDLIQGACGFAESDTQKLMDLADTAQTNLCEVADILTRVRLFFQCENWFPIYETTAYEALCHDGTDGFAYIASTQFVIVFMAFVILTFRVAFWDVQIGDGLDPEDGLCEDNEVKQNATDDTTQNDENEDRMYYSGITGLLKSSGTRSGEHGVKDKSEDHKWIAHAEADVAPDHTFSTFDTTVYVDGVEDETHAHASETSTQENTDDDDASGDLVLEHQRSSRDTDEGVEVGHFHNRSDAWSIWARQFTNGGGDRGWPAANDWGDDDDDRNVHFDNFEHFH